MVSNEGAKRWRAKRQQGIDRNAPALRCAGVVATGHVKGRFLRSRDQRISAEGVVIIKGQRYRSQERNREDPIARLREIVEQAATVTPERRPTRPTRASQRRRVDSEVRRGEIKVGRRKPADQ